MLGATHALANPLTARYAHRARPGDRLDAAARDPLQRPAVRPLVSRPARRHRWLERFSRSGQRFRGAGRFRRHAGHARPGCPPGCRNAASSERSWRSWRPKRPSNGPAASIPDRSSRPSCWNYMKPRSESGNSTFKGSAMPPTRLESKNEHPRASIARVALLWVGLLALASAGCGGSDESAAAAGRPSAPISIRPRWLPSNRRARSRQSIAPVRRAAGPCFAATRWATDVATSTLPETLDVLWTFSSEQHGFEATAVIADGLVYVGSLDGNFYVLNLEDGKEKWRYHTELGFSARRPSTMAAYSSAMPTASSTVSRPPPANRCGPPRQTPRSTPGRTSTRTRCSSVPRTPRSIATKRPADKLVWKYAIGDQIRCSPTIVDGKAFLAGCDAKLHIVDLEKGEATATVEIDAPTGSTPAVGGTRVFFGTEGSSFFGIDWQQAKVIWNMKSPRNMPFRSSAAVTDEEVIFGGRDKQIYALDPADGHELWKFATRSRVDSSPVVVGQRVFVGSSDGRLYALDCARRAKNCGITRPEAISPPRPPWPPGGWSSATPTARYTVLERRSSAAAPETSRRECQPGVSRAPRAPSKLEKKQTTRWQSKRPKPRWVATSSRTTLRFRNGRPRGSRQPARPSIRRRSCRRRQPAGSLGPVLAHSLLPQALQVLLLSRLHRQERRRRRNLRRGPVARDRAGQPLADHG